MKESRWSDTGWKEARPGIYDAIQSAWTRLAAKMKVKKIRLGMKHLRKTSASLLGQHPHFKFYANHFLADSPSDDGGSALCRAE